MSSEHAMWLCCLSNFVQPDCLRQYDRTTGLFVESLEEVRISLQKASKIHENGVLFALSNLSEEEIAAIRDKVFDNVKRELSNYLPESLYYNDAEMDENLGYRMRRSALKALEETIESWR